MKYLLITLFSFHSLAFERIDSSVEFTKKNFIIKADGDVTAQIYKLETNKFSIYCDKFKNINHITYKDHIIRFSDHEDCLDVSYEIINGTSSDSNCRDTSLGFTRSNSRYELTHIYEGNCSEF